MEATSVGYGQQSRSSTVIQLLKQKTFLLQGTDVSAGFCKRFGNQLLHHPVLPDVTSLHLVTSPLPVHATYIWHPVLCICDLLLHVAYTGNTAALVVSACS